MLLLVFVPLTWMLFRFRMRKEEEGKQKANMDRLKLIQNIEIAEDKLEQDDDHAKLRASVSLAKDGIKQMKAAVIEGE